MALGEYLLNAAAKAAVEKATTPLVARYGKSVLDTLEELVSVLRHLGHPTLEDLREICDYLDSLRPQSCGSIETSFNFPTISDASPFKRNDKSPKEVAERWFRMDKLDEGMKEIVNTLIAMGDKRQPYFYGGAEFDYGDILIKEAQRHPVFRIVEPFIMLSRVERSNMSADPVGDTLKFFVDSWRKFVQPEYTEFKMGTMIQVEDQAFAEGYITITNKSEFRWSKKQQNISENVTLWRCLMVTARPLCLDIMNVGIPVAEVGGREYLDHFKTWMKDFRHLI
jgi:hypothetical protein